MELGRAKIGKMKIGCPMVLKASDYNTIILKSGHAELSGKRMELDREYRIEKGDKIELKDGGCEFSLLGCL